MAQANAGPAQRLGEIRDERLAQMADLEDEIAIVYRELVEPRWDIDTRRFARTLYAYVIATFSFVDLLSAYRYGEPKQTERMRRFLTHYLGADRDVAVVAVKLWRHTLVHTANPQILTDKASQLRHRWLLHWATQLPREHHMTITSTGPNDSVLNAALFYFVADVRRAAGQLFDDAARDQAIRDRVVAVDGSMRAAPL